ncbi:LytR/AlgR family response regulator transcription factor [Aliivibrio fischeri]|uniref:LytR/AlgR family response regulator transcription factor n=1 Tax=Aliivibrio fischeri TaxID=668 RepID=UPI0012D87CBB|nr:LytTR family DNA-binding domain-containing protein [Aliivibrio fischeri]MUI54487.1 response regulator [Aliivibrio fischeri]
MSQSITTIIADDEPLLRFHLEKMLSDLWHDLDIVAVCANGKEALDAIEQHQPDIAFLDIKMPELDGMALAAKLQKSTVVPLIVFITAYDEFAVKAFENNAIDYVLKPISETRLEATCEKLKQRVTQQNKHSAPKQNQDVLSDLFAQIQQLSAQQQPEYLCWIKAYKGEDLHLISVSDVLYFKAEDKYVSVYAKQNDIDITEYLIRSSLKELQQKINPDHFWQIHRSSIVNVAQIEKVKKDLLGHLCVHIGSVKLPVSRSAQSLFKGM